MWQREEPINDCHQIPEEAGDQNPQGTTTGLQQDLVAAGTEVSFGTVILILMPEQQHVPHY